LWWALMMEAASTSETLVNIYQTTRSKHLWNAGKVLPDYTAQQLRKVIFILAAVRTWNLTTLYWFVGYLKMLYE
jgi:hypothetical protein